MPAGNVETDLARRRRTGYAYGCLVVLLFAGFILVSRAGLASVLTLPDVAALRFGVSAALLLPFLLRHGFGDLRLTQVMGVTALGGIGFALLAYAGFALAPASHGGILMHGTLALTTALIAWALRLPQSRPGRVLGLLVVAAGAAVTAWDGWAEQSPLTLVGDLCLIAASFSWSGYGLYVSHLGVSAVRAAATVAATSAVLFLPIYVVIPGKMLPAAPWQDVLFQAVFQGGVIGAGSIFIYTRAVTLLGPAQVSLFASVVPTFSLVGGLVLLGEGASVAATVGVLLTTAGLMAVYKGESARKRR